MQREAAERAARIAAEAEKAAREAEARESEALENAAVGEVGVDVVQVTYEADQAFDDYERKSRFAARAERDAKVKIGGGFGRTAALREKETLVVEDAVTALAAVGLTDKISEALLSAARDYRKRYDALPPGIGASYERVL